MIYTKSLISSQNIYAQAFHLEAPDVFYSGGGFRGSLMADNTFISGGSGYSVYLGRYAHCLVPQILSQSNSGSVCSASNVILQTSAIGTGISYQWYKDTVLLPGDTSSQLTFNVTDTSHSGNYTCIVTGLCGADTTQPILFTVHPLPEVTITASPGLLSATPGFATYAWYNNQLPTGVTTSTYSNPVPGIYYVVVTDLNGCVDTSLYVSVAAGLSELNGEIAFVYYDKDHEVVRFGFSETVIFPLGLELIDNNGRLLLVERIRGLAHQLSVDMLPPGIYLLRFSKDERVSHHRFVIDR